MADATKAVDAIVGTTAATGVQVEEKKETEAVVVPQLQEEKLV